jgi:hypothetical protein
MRKGVNEVKAKGFKRSKKRSKKRRKNAVKNKIKAKRFYDKKHIKYNYTIILYAFHY